MRGSSRCASDAVRPAQIRSRRTSDQRPKGIAEPEIEAEYENGGAGEITLLHAAKYEDLAEVKEIPVKQVKA